MHNETFGVRSKNPCSLLPTWCQITLAKRGFRIDLCKSVILFLGFQIYFSATVPACLRGSDPFMLFTVRVRVIWQHYEKSTTVATLHFLVGWKIVLYSYAKFLLLSAINWYEEGFLANGVCYIKCSCTRWWVSLGKEVLTVV